MSTDKNSGGFSDFEKEAMRNRARELAAESRASNKKAQGEKAVKDAIEAMSGLDRTLAEQIHKIVTKVAPHLWPKTWYGMPAYATKEGKVVCFFQSAEKFEARYASLGFNDSANLDSGNMWPTAFALVALSAAEEARIADLVSKAASN